MNREIKFRAMDTSGEEWRFGLLGYDMDGDYIFLNDGGWECCVDFDTLGQYTGLKDKNGVEIYEGDIVSHWKQGNRVVIYPMSDTYAGFGVISADGMKNVLSDTENLYEVIGNIHQNPELLK